MEVRRLTVEAYTHLGVGMQKVTACETRLRSISTSSASVASGIPSSVLRWRAFDLHTFGLHRAQRVGTQALEEVGVGRGPVEELLPPERRRLTQSALPTRLTASVGLPMRSALQDGRSR